MEPFIRHLLDLERQAQYRPQGIDSDFLTPEEFSAFWNARSLFLSAPQIHEPTWERKLLHFGEGEATIDLLHIRSKSGRFARFTHPDVLGAIMGLGIERKTIGDLIVKDLDAYLYCKPPISSWIVQSLAEVGHARVDVEFITSLPEEVQQRTEGKEHILSSLRVDRAIATLFHTSRTHADTWLREGRVFCNGIQVKKNSFMLSEGDLLSVRRAGKVRIGAVLRETTKGNLVVHIEHFI